MLSAVIVNQEFGHSFGHSAFSPESRFNSNGNGMSSSAAQRFLALCRRPVLESANARDYTAGL